MKKGLKYLIFLLVIFLSMTNVKAANDEFFCKLMGSYNVKYNSKGNIVDLIVLSTGKSAKDEGITLSSDFHPTKISECPSDANVQIDMDFDNNYNVIKYTINKGPNYKEPESCNEIINENECKTHSGDFTCVWNEEKNYCNVDNLTYIKCGDTHDIPAQLPAIISMIVNMLKIATPIILIIVSIITLVKAIMASKEDEIKKAQHSLVTKVIAAVMVFLIISIVQFVVLKVADEDEEQSISSCMSCFLNNDCGNVEYYKTNILGEYYCTIIGGEPEICKEFYEK